MDLRTRTGNNFTAGMLCSLPTLHMQQVSNEPGTATGVVEQGMVTPTSAILIAVTGITICDCLNLAVTL